MSQDAAKAICAETDKTLQSLSCKLEASGWELAAGFIDQVDAVWNSAIFGLSVSNIMVGIGILYLFFLLRSLFSRFVIAAL